MLRNYLRVAWRNLVRNKVYSAINVAGLGIGMAGAIIIFQLVSYHLGVDKHHAQADKIFRMVVDLHLEDGSVEHEKGSAFALHTALRKEFANVSHAAYLAERELTISIEQANNSKKFFEKSSAAFTDSEFFKIFDYQFLAGNAAVLNVPGHIVITERYAQKYFGKSNPMGRLIRLNNAENVTVAGVIKDFPEQTDFKKDVFVSLPTLKKLIPEYGYEDWGWIDSNRETFVSLRSEEDKAALENQLVAFAKKIHGADSNVFHYHLQPLSDIHFNMNYGGKIKYYTIVMLATVGLLLILIACFNFINISTAQSFKRSKEVGIRKVLGVSQWQVFWLFIYEAALFSGMSFVLSILLSKLLAPVISNWLEIIVEVNIFTDFTLLAFSFLLLFFVVCVAGIYPALVISNLNPIRAIKGMTLANDGGSFSVRKGLVVAQFSISFVLIAVSMVIILQSRYLKNKDLGLNKDLILHVGLPETETAKIEALSNEIPGIKEVASISFFRNPPSSQAGNGGSIKFENRDWEKFVARSRVADNHYIATYGLKLIAGRNAVQSDTLHELLINNKLAKSLGLKSPEEALNKRLVVGDMDNKTGVIVGVLSDFNNADLYSTIEPTVIYASKKHYRSAGIKLQNLSASTIPDIMKVWQKHFPEYVFQYSFYDEEIAGFYKREELASNLTSMFALLSVFLSCLGLFGLALFSIEQRTKEIGIRKVLGASIASITTLLSMDFLRLVAIAIIIASPVSYFFMNKWLQDFAFRIDIEWWIFAVSALLAIAIACLTVGYQSVKAALANPVKTLKTE
ncbi:FtsX-like permease family protein [Dyadobacter sp. CY347]|uniref:FtsX-like permease family protein n=1 Tax=Dyadobacter sp. CY347 TaxID=2909336 RepID=UPI001F32EF4F|nr:FtsX-like permease family protein [Dyadobacter sp. CY347]MCF2488304.1 ABC transporter permease [Dyadobacter sp. CY347]